MSSRILPSGDFVAESTTVARVLPSGDYVVGEAAAATVNLIAIIQAVSNVVASSGAKAS